jgi:hypothetical protein
LNLHQLVESHLGKPNRLAKIHCSKSFNQRVDIVILTYPLLDVKINVPSSGWGWMDMDLLLFISFLKIEEKALSEKFNFKKVKKIQKFFAEVGIMRF